MALEKNITIVKDNFTGALTAKNAYWKVVKLTGNKQSIMIEVNAFVNDEKVDGYITSFTPNLNGANFIAQAYEHLKTLPEFAGASDC